MTTFGSSVPVMLDSARLTTPFVHPGVVERSDLLAALAATEPWTVLSVVAPAGSGKSILMSQWADHQAGATAWVTLDHDANDSTVLMAYLATALAGVVDVEPELLLDPSAEYAPTMRVGRRLANLMTTAPGPIQLVLDDVQKVSNPLCLDVVATLARHASPVAQVAIGSRQELALGLPRLRAEGRVAEVGPSQLALRPTEARALVTRVGADLADEDLAALLAGTRGWAVAVYLAARSVREGVAVDLAGLGRNPDVADYVRAELLASLDADQMRFLLRSSVLDRMSGPSCDAVLSTFGSQARLEASAESNLLVRRLDHEGAWFRYHDLFRDMLHAELERHDPAAIPGLLRRAAHWHETHGDREAAIEYAIAGGDVDRAAALVAALAVSAYQTRSATLERWITWFEDQGLLASYPRVALAGAWSAALDGRAASAERRAVAAERASQGDGELAPAVMGQLALLQGVMCRHGVDQALDAVERAGQLLTVDSIWYPTMLVVRGLVRLLHDDEVGAASDFAEGAAAGDDFDSRPAQTVALAELALQALERHEPQRAEQLSRRALEVVENHRLENHVPSALTYAVAARLAARSGDGDRARAMLASAQRLRPRLTHAFPHLAVQVRIELVRVLLAAADVAGARTLLREIGGILGLRPGLGRVEEQAGELRKQVEAMPAGAAGAHTLTTAELRLLPLLQTHLNFREIGERLFVSPNTIKTQAISVYRKLHVSSRSDAVEAAVAVGLLEPW